MIIVKVIKLELHQIMTLLYVRFLSDDNRKGY